MPSAALVIEETDRGLVAGMAHGDENAMADLYDRLGAPLYALAFRMLGERADAEEVVMEAFMQAWKNAETFDHRRGSVGAWLTVMVRSRAIDRCRARSRQEKVVVHGGSEEAAGVSTQREDPSRSVEVSEQRRIVIAALNGLPEAQREAIALAYYDGLSQTQIAEKLQLPLGTVKTRIRDGMRKLRSVLLPLYAEQGT